MLYIVLFASLYFGERLISTNLGLSLVYSLSETTFMENSKNIKKPK